MSNSKSLYEMNVKKKKKKSFNKRQFEEIIRRSLADTISKLSVRVLSRKRRRNDEEEKKEHVEDNEVHGIIWNLIEMKEEGSIEASTFRPEPFQLN